MVNFRNYVKDAVQTELYESKITLTSKEVDSIIDTIVFDWNETGDWEADMNTLVEWNVNQYLTHA